MDFSAWEPSRYETSLEPLDDVMKEILARNGPVGPENEYLAKPKGQWLAVPGIRGTLFLTACSRICGGTRRRTVRSSRNPSCRR